MVWSRKHYRGSYAADLWVMDVAAKTSRRILDAELPDNMKPNNFWPMYGNGAIYFVSDRSPNSYKAGTPQVLTSINNIWVIGENGGQPEQLTRHTSGSLFWPSLSSDGNTIVYEENFGLWKLDLGSKETREIKIDITLDEKENNLETLTINGEADSFHLSPSGKRAVISTHGELFTIATDKGDVTRLTRSPGARDGQPSWSPDGKWIAFVSDQTGREEVWLCDERGGQPKQISNIDSQKSQLVWSPDGKELVFSGSDKKLHKYTLENGKTAVLVSGDVVGFGGSAVMGPHWSPDGKWIAYTKSSPTLLPHVHIIPAAGGEEKRITDLSSYSDSNAVWTPDGKKLIFLSGTDTGNIGQSGRSTAQIFSVSLNKEEKNPNDRDIDSEEDAAAADKQNRPSGRSRPEGTPGGPGGAEGAPRTPAKVEVTIDFDKMARRIHQLTTTGDTIGSMAISPDSKTLVFVTTGTEGGRPVNSIWSLQLEGQRLTRVVQGSRPTPDAEGPPVPTRGGFGGFNSLQITKDNRTLFYRQGTGIYSANLGGGSGGGDAPALPGSIARGRRGAASPAPADPGTGTSGTRVNFTVRVDVDHKAERKQVFNEAWRVMKHRFYAADMHGVDWNKIKTVYEPLLEFVHDQEELHDVVNMMIGELNASHTGISGGRGRTGGGRGTGSRHPGFDLEPGAGGFYKVTHIYKNGPADKDWVKINVGDYILAVGDQPLKAGDNYWKFFADHPGSKLEFTVNSKPAQEGAWKTKVTPISGSQLTNLQYEKWVADRRAMTDKLSNSEIGYLHIRQMNDNALRQFEKDLAQLHLKKALVIDQRFNPGGGIDQELLQILQQKQYQYTKVRDSINVTRPLRGFFGPMVVMENERSTSDAEVFPDGFRTLKLGKVVGVTTYGAVIGTGSHQLMDGSSIRTPGSGLWNVNGTNLENYGVPPDVYVDNTPEDFLKGRDAQLEKAVDVLKEELKKK
jgi:tricorn protease